MIAVEIGPFGWEVVKIGNAAHRAIRMHLIIYGALGLAVSHLDVRNWAQAVERGLTALVSTVAFHYVDWLGVPFETHRWRSSRIRACFLIHKWILLNIESTFSRFVFTLDDRERHKPRLQSCIILLLLLGAWKIRVHIEMVQRLSDITFSEKLLLPGFYQFIVIIDIVEVSGISHSWPFLIPVTHLTFLNRW